MQIDLSSLGLTVEDVRERVIQQITNSFLTTTVADEDGEPVVIVSHFRNEIKKLIQDSVVASVERLAAPVLEQSINTYLDGFKIASTNTYGEPKREPETITEYIVRRANEYLTEGVNWQGKSKKDYRPSDSYNFKAETTRVAYLVDKRLNEEIAKAMTEALKTANESITAGLKSAVNFELNKINAKLKGNV